jgi:hypothetical protein
MKISWPSYNKFKEFEGKQYTGMKVGRSQERKKDHS